MERIVSPVELEELRVAVFHAHIDLCALLVKNKNFLIKELRSASACAMEIVDFVPSLRLTYAQHAIFVGYHLADLNLYNDAISLFQRSLTTIELVQSSNLTGFIPSELTSDLNKLKWRCILSLAYLHKELE